MFKKVLPVFISILVIYFIWCFMRPSFSFHSIKRRINDIHSQDAFTSSKISDDNEIKDEIYYLAESKGIYPEEMDISLERYDSLRIKTIEVYYTDYVLIFNYEIVTRNYSYVSKTEDRRRSL